MLRRKLYRIHLWLGWLIGVPLLFWTGSGLWMVSRPIDEVRGTALKAKPLLLAPLSNVIRPDTESRAARTMLLEQQVRGPRWVVTFHDGSVARADPATGRFLAALNREEASAIARAAYLGHARLTGLRHFVADANPIDLRGERPAWQASFTDGAHVYIDSDTGQLLAIRTSQWRTYDWMWGLHIMDLQTREESSHFILVVFAALAGLGTLAGMILLPMASRRKRRISSPQ